MSDQALIMAAARLARSAPSQWDEFMGALQIYNTEAMKQCIQSPSSELAKNQGHAQGIARLVGVLTTSRDKADKQESKRP